MSTPEHDEGYEAHHGWLADRPWAHALGTKAPFNIAAMMRGTQEPPEMLIPGWLVKGVLHWLYADAEAGKTWLAAVWARDVMAAGGVVIWVDEELGQIDTAQRLLALGVPPDVAERQMVYFPFPAWSMADAEEWRNLLAGAQPALVVIDTATDALANAGLDENSGADVTRWVKAFAEPATRVHATTVVLDHTGRNDGTKPGKHAVGSRGKRAKAKVQYAMICKRRYDRSTLGRVQVLLTKNTLGATLPPDPRTFKVGGDGTGHFTWEQVDIDLEGGGTPLVEMMGKVRAALAERPGIPLNATQVKGLVPGTDKLKLDALAELTSSDLDPEITVAPGPRNSLLYTYTPRVTTAPPGA